MKLPGEYKPDFSVFFAISALTFERSFPSLPPSLSFMHMSVFSHVCMCNTCVPDFPKDQKKGEISPGAGGTDGCEMPSGCWELNSGSLQEQ